MTRKKIKKFIITLKRLNNFLFTQLIYLSMHQKKKMLETLKKIRFAMKENSNAAFSLPPSKRNDNLNFYLYEISNTPSTQLIYYLCIGGTFKSNFPPPRYHLS